MNTTCKNCENNFEGHYCNNCGQSAATHRIDIHYLWHDIQHGLFHFEKKLWRTLKSLIVEPGVLIRNYIAGKRERYYSPISLVIVLATFYAFLSHSFHVNLFIESTTNSAKDDIHLDYHQLNEWFISHYSWIALLMIPLYALANKICFRKQDYNFIEYIIVNCYVSSQLLLLRLFFFPLEYYLDLNTENTLAVQKGLSTISMGFIVWTYYQFFNKIKPSKRLLLSLLSCFLFVIFVFIIAILILLFYIKR